MPSLEKFVQTTLQLLEVEREAEIEQTRILHEQVSPKELQRKGVCLLKLRIGGRHTGLYGRTVLSFEPSWPGSELASHSFSSGDIVGVALSQGDSSQEQLASGIVSRVTQTAVSVAFDESFDTVELDDSAQYRLVKLANDITYKRLKGALNTLNTYRSGPANQLINVLFETGDVSLPYNSNQELEFYNPNLDESQREAVRFALHQREIAVIHGPPGTGKTTTVVEIIKQAINNKFKVLVCAPSNIAVDNLVERLVGGKSKVVRLGHPARLLGTIQKYSLDAILSGSDETKLVDDVRKDLNKTLSSMKKKQDKGSRQKLREEMKFLRKELRQREEAATRDILQRADVVLATLTSAHDHGPIKHLDQDHFDLVVIDECSQSLEAACWLALLKSPRCILAGDHQQLPPTILSHKAAKDGLEKTLMERVLGLHGDKVMRMLTMQYRMHELIMKWSSDQLYDGKLKAHQSVAKHLLRDLPGVEENDETQLPLLLIDTAGCDLPEMDVPEEVSKGNEGEADLVAIHVEKLVTSGLPADEIAVIAPYNLQVELLRLRLSQKYPKLEIKSVDGFQGREKEAVIISLVRSNKTGEVGFLSEDRRINVAITRARRHLVVVCDTETVSQHSFLKSLVEYMSSYGEVRSAHEYQEGYSVGVSSNAPPSLQGMSSSSSSASARHPKGTGAKPKTKTPSHAGPTVTNRPVSGHKTGSSISRKPHDNKAISVDSPAMTALKTTVEAFAADPSKKDHAFPSSLNSHERHYIHELAEQLGLLHVSKGEGEERYIAVGKPPQSHSQASSHGHQVEPPQVQNKEATRRQPEKVENLSKSARKKQKKREKADLNNKPEIEDQLIADEAEKNDDMEEEEEEKNDVDFVCGSCGKKIPVQNRELHTIHCARKANEASTAPATTGQAKNKTKKKKKDKNTKPDLAQAKEEDFDALIAMATKMNTKCQYPKCKASTSCLGQNCEFCAKRYCLSHHIPEVHGCGDAAKQRARKLIVKEGVLYRGSGVPNKKPDPIKRAHMQRKLDSKLNDMADARKHKKKEK